MVNRTPQVRTAIAGSVLFAFYAALAWFAYQAGAPLALVVAGSLVFAAVLYRTGRRATLHSVALRCTSSPPSRRRATGSRA